MIFGGADADDISNDWGVGELFGQGGDDVIESGWEDDQVFGGEGDDTIWSGPGHDSVAGEAGDDYIVGEGGNDVIEGSLGNDTLYGGYGNDTIIPGPGADTVWAGPGDDEIIIRDVCELSEGKVIDGGSGYDVLKVPVGTHGPATSAITTQNIESIVAVDAGQACSSDCTLPCDSVPSRFKGLPDPASWSADPETGARYRRATAAERARHDWPEGTFVAEQPFLQQAEAGATSIQLLVPQSDAEAQLATLRLAATTEDLQVISRGVEIIQSSEIDVFTYVAGLELETGWLPDNGTWLQGISGEGLGLDLQGLVNGENVTIATPGANWDLDAISHSGPAIDQSSLSKITLEGLGPYGGGQLDDCTDLQAPAACDWICANLGVPCGPNNDVPRVDHCHEAEPIDNDGDGKADSGDEECLHHPSPFASDPAISDFSWSCDVAPVTHRHRWESGKSFALFGEGQFCTAMRDKNDTSWVKQLLRKGRRAEELLNQAASQYPEHVPLSGGENSYRLVAVGCWLFPSVADAQSCADGEPCLTADSEQYPYRGAGTRPRSYTDAVWSDVQHAMQNGLKDVLHMAQVVYIGRHSGLPDSDDIRTEQLDCGGGEGCCGLTPTGFGPAIDGSSVAMHYPCKISTSAHELGHTVGLQHDDDPDGLGCSPDGFMCSISRDSPATSGVNQSLLDTALRTWDEPRPSGFKYRGPVE